MKLTNKEREEKLMELVRYIAGSYIELSNDQVMYQRNDFVMKARSLLKEFYVNDQEDERIHSST